MVYRDYVFFLMLSCNIILCEDKKSQMNERNKLNTANLCIVLRDFKTMLDLKLNELYEKIILKIDEHMAKTKSNEDGKSKQKNEVDRSFKYDDTLENNELTITYKAQYTNMEDDVLKEIFKDVSIQEEIQLNLFEELKQKFRDFMPATSFEKIKMSDFFKIEAQSSGYTITMSFSLPKLHLNINDQISTTETFCIKAQKDK